MLVAVILVMYVGCSLCVRPSGPGEVGVYEKSVANVPRVIVMRHYNLLYVYMHIYQYMHTFVYKQTYMYLYKPGM